MIRQASTRRFCFVCHKPATRRVHVDHVDEWMCDSCPSPAQLVERRNAIRDRWSPSELEARRLDCPQSLLPLKRAWRLPVCQVGELE